jgi:hypothetical protein
MTTRINIAVDSGGLLNRNAQQTSANRQAKLTQNVQAKAGEDGKAEQEKRRLQASLDRLTGKLLAGNNASRIQRINQEPAAFRQDTDKYLYWFPTPPNIQIQYLYGDPPSRDPYTSNDADILIYKGRTPKAPFNFRLRLANYTHTSGYSYLPNGGRFGEPAVYLQAPAVPLGAFIVNNGFVSLGATGSTTYTNLGITKPFSEFTTELEFAMNAPVTVSGTNVFVRDDITITDQAATNRLSVLFEVTRLNTTVNLRLVASVRNLQTNVNTIYASVNEPVASGVFVFNNANLWNRCTLVYTPSALLFFVNGLLLKTVAYAFPVTINLSPSTTIKNSAVNCNNTQPKDIKVSISSFTPKALYSGNYTLASLLR